MTVAERLDDVRGRVAGAASRAARDPDVITIVGISKEQPDAAIAAARAAGLVDFGENRVDPFVRRVRAHPDVRWHFVGQLQRRKVRDVVGRAALIHSLDRERLADAVSRAAVEASIVQPVLVQVDVTGNPRRGGVDVAEVAALVAYASALPGVRVTGLMIIPPLDEEPREHFRAVRELRDRLVIEHPTVTELSMGMTEDFEVAIEEGATIVRPGTALFGDRAAGAEDQDDA